VNTECGIMDPWLEPHQPSHSFPVCLIPRVVSALWEYEADLRVKRLCRLDSAGKVYRHPIRYAPIPKVIVTT